MPNRRGWMIAGIGLIGAGALAWSNRNELLRSAMRLRSNDDLNLTNALEDADAVCTLSPEQTDGPFFTRAPVRQDVREDRNGLQLDLELTILSAATGCAPLAGATVEIWHCDAAGIYSAYPDDLSRKPFDTVMLLAEADETGHVSPSHDSRFLRGAQLSDADGRVRFTTILPGWYDPRVPHIHVKVFDGEKALYATQLYFPETLTDRVYAEHPDYAPHGPAAFSHSNDAVLAEYPGAQGLLLAPAQVAQGLRASARLTLT